MGQLHSYKYNNFYLRVDMDVFKLNRDGFKQNDLEVGRGVSGFLSPIPKLNDDEDGNRDGRKNIGVLASLPKNDKNIDHRYFN